MRDAPNLAPGVSQIAGTGAFAIATFDGILVLPIGRSSVQVV
jgi:hypothetical protein